MSNSAQKNLTRSVHFSYSSHSSRTHTILKLLISIPRYQLPPSIQSYSSSIQCLSAQCIYCQSVRAKNTSRQRQHLLECPNYLSAMKEHNPDNPILHESINGTPTVTPSAKPKKRDHDTMIGFQGDSSASRTFPIPKPVLERDFQMSVQLNPKISVGPGIWGQRNWVGYISGHWNGRWGKGTVVVRLCCAHS